MNRREFLDQIVAWPLGAALPEINPSVESGLHRNSFATRPTAHIASIPSIRSPRELADMTLKELNELRNTYIKTGTRDLYFQSMIGDQTYLISDDLVAANALMPGELTVIVGRPSPVARLVGLNVVKDYVWNRAVPAVLFTTLDTGERALEIVLQSALGTEEDWGVNGLQPLRSFQRAHEALVQRAPPLYVDDDCDESIEDVVNRAQELKRVVPDLGLVVLDAIYFTQQTARGNVPLTALKQLATDLGVVALLVSSFAFVNLGKMSQRPALEHLRDFEGLFENADCVGLTWCNSLRSKSTAWQRNQRLEIDIHRPGEGTAQRRVFCFQPQRSRFLPWIDV